MLRRPAMAGDTEEAGGSGARAASSAAGGLASGASGVGPVQYTLVIIAFLVGICAHSAPCAVPS